MKNTHAYSYADPTCSNGNAYSTGAVPAGSTMAAVAALATSAIASYSAAGDCNIVRYNYRIEICQAVAIDSAAYGRSAQALFAISIACNAAVASGSAVSANISTHICTDAHGSNAHSHIYTIAGASARAAVAAIASISACARAAAAASSGNGIAGDIASQQADIRQAEETS